MEQKSHEKDNFILYSLAGVAFLSVQFLMNISHQQDLISKIAVYCFTIAIPFLIAAGFMLDLDSKNLQQKTKKNIYLITAKIGTWLSYIGLWLMFSTYDAILGIIFIIASLLAWFILQKFAH